MGLNALSVTIYPHFKPGDCKNIYAKYFFFHIFANEELKGVLEFKILQSYMLDSQRYPYTFIYATMRKMSYPVLLISVLVSVALFSSHFYKKPPFK